MRFPPVRSAAWTAFAVVVAVRLIVGLSRLDDSTFQFYTANIAVAVLEGLPLELVELPLIPHNRGSMLAGFLAIPFVAVANTLFAIKCEAILLAGVTAFLFVRSLELGVGRAAAWAGAGLYALLPPAFQILDVMPLGSHVDTVLFDFAALACVLAWPRGSDAGPGRSFALGMLCGAGLFFSFHFLVVLPALFVAWWAAGSGALRPRNMVAFAVGGGLLVAPAALFVADASAATQVVNKPLLDWLLAPGAALQKLVAAVTTTWPRAWSFEAHGGTWARWTFASCVLAGLALCVPRLRRREPCTVFVVAYPFLLLVAFALTGFELNTEGTSGLGSRQIAPAMPCLAAWIAVGVQELVERGAVRVAAVLGGAAAAAGLAGVVALVDLRVWRGQPPVRGSDFSMFKQHVARASGGDPARILEWLDVLEPDWAGFRPLISRDLRWERVEWPSPDDFLADVRDAASRPERQAPYYLVHIGRSAAQDDPTALAMDELAAGVRAEHGEERTTLLLLGHGYGILSRAMQTQLRRRATGAHHGRPLPSFEHVETLDPRTGRDVARGMGFHFGEMVSPYHGAVRGVVGQVSRLPERLQREFYVGAGWGYRMRFVEASYVPPTYLRLRDELPPEHVDDFDRGLDWGPRP